MTRLALAVGALLLALTGCSTTSTPDPRDEPQRIASPDDKPDATTDQTQALEAARGYLSMSFMSAKTLRNQLAFDRHPPDAITYAMDHVDADWDAEAVEAAEIYRDSGLGLSKEGLRDQLMFEGFTKDQTAQAIERTWKRN